MILKTAAFLAVIGTALGTVSAGLLAICCLSLPVSALPVDFVTVAEGLTAPGPETGIEVAFRMFYLPAIPKLCANAPGPSRLLSRNEAIVLTVNRRFLLNALHIEAVDESGRALTPVPIVVEVERTSPPLFDLSPEQISDAKLLPIRAGRFRFRARNFCPGPAVETSVPAVITVGAELTK
jgi:hypothetical protein